MVLSLRCTGRSVTANIPALGAGDSGFESRRPDLECGSDGEEMAGLPRQSSHKVNEGGL